METNEAEVLAKAYSAAMTDGGKHWDALLAVAAKARELDAARGGTLSVEDVRRIRRDTASGKALSADDGRGLALHSAAQGRTIAALEAQVREAREEVEVAREEFRAMRYERDEARATIAAKDARIVELEKLACNCSHVTRMLAKSGAHLASCPAAIPPAHGALLCGCGCGRVLVDSDAPRAMPCREQEQRAAESALTTLRQAAHWLIFERSAIHPVACRCGVCVRADDVARGISTPIEHPDTATLRKVRAYVERMPCKCETYADGAKMTCHRCMLSASLGDFGPSGGGENAPAVSAATLPDAESLDALAEALSTTPPDVAASETGAVGWFEARIAAPTPTPEEDWRDFYDLCAAWMPVAQWPAAQSMLARLKAEPRRAAERMRERCDHATLNLTPPASLVVRCKSAKDADVACASWREAIDAAVATIRALEVSP